jgi:NADH:ubiquinone oxidoreductase subunit 5 (subunit L)/multisubunit Na+/H+ antiporter MnhA subunit
MPFTSSSLMVPNFALCGLPFWAGFYSRDFILETFSMRYVDMFGFFVVVSVYRFNSLLFFPFILFCYSA